MYRDNRITVIVPCLNEEDAIGKVIESIPKLVDEIIIVDNGSEDRTAKIAEELGAKVIHEPNRGYGRAYKAGFKNAVGDIIITLDGDHSYPAQDIHLLIDFLLKKNADFLSASRFPLKNKESMSFKHYVGNKMLSFTMCLLFHVWIEDSQSGMWVFKKNILDKMKLRSNGMAFSEEIKIEALIRKDVKFIEKHISYSNRVGEKKLQPYRDGMKNILFLFKKRFFG
ncbi:MAG: glycosyltransferase family 2 protein [Nitrospinae bacterium]|nr:glycosyltransferase family 2 protein [Nitrospinota bacterium]